MTRLIRDLRTDAPTAADTEEVASTLGAGLEPGDLVSLDGPLGAGKTVFVRGLARGRGVDPLLVRSPTFVFHHVYAAPPRLHHLDLYRLGGGASVSFLDIDTLLESAPVAVEWGGLADLARWRPLRLRLDIGPGESRRITAIETDQTPKRLLGAWLRAARAG